MPRARNRALVLSRRKRLLFSLLGVILLLAAAELTLRLLSALSPAVNAVLSAPPQHRAVADESLGWSGNPNFPEHDAHGFRNPSIPDRAKVVALGDSMTYGATVSRDEAWPQQLETITGQTTYNMAFGGWGPIQSLVLIDDAIKMRPALIIEGLYFGNDAADAYFSVYLRGQASYLRSRDETTLATLAKSEEADPWSDLATLSRLSSASDPKLVSLWKALGRAYRSLNPDAGGEDIPFQGGSGGENGWPFQGSGLRTRFLPERLKGIDLENPRIDEGLRVSLEAINRMEKRAGAANVRFVVLGVPTKELVFKDAVYRSSGHVPGFYRTLVENEELVWREAREAFARSDITYVDALPKLREMAESGRQPYWELDNGHPNALGQRAIAEAIAEAVGR